MIDELCTECSALIENHEKIQVLSSVHYNLGKTLQASVQSHFTTVYNTLQLLYGCVDGI